MYGKRGKNGTPEARRILDHKKYIFGDTDMWCNRMTKRAAFYVRVSTDGQTVENQLSDLHEVAQRMSWDVVEVFSDEGISGAKGRDRRPGLDRMMKGITRMEFDLVAAWSVCRIGRSLQDLAGFLNEVNDRNIDLYLHRQGLDTSSPAGRMMFQLLGVFSEYERAMIQDRVRAGVQRRIAAGLPHGRPRVSEERIAAIRESLNAGTGIQKTARQVGVGVSVVQRVKKELVTTEG